MPAWERGRKDVYRLRPGGSVTITMQFRDWGGMFMEHCHNTVPEDNSSAALGDRRQRDGVPEAAADADSYAKRVTFEDPYEIFP